MNITKKIIVNILFLIILSSFALATRNHFNYGNVDYSALIEGDKHVVFSSLSPSNHDTTPISCQIPVAAEFSPVVGDFNNDGTNWLVYATTSNRIQIYDFGCNLIQNIVYGEDIQAMPVIRNYDGDEFIDIIVMGDTTFTIYEWDLTLEQMVILTSMPTYGANLEGLSCDFSSNNLTCISVDTPSTVVYSLLSFPGNFTTEVIVGSNLDTLSESGGIVGGIAGGRFTTETPETQLWNAKLGNSIIESPDHEGATNQCFTGVSDAAADVDTFSGGLGASTTATHLFASGYSESPTKRKFYAICDNTYTQVLLFQGQSGAKEDITNWAVTDFDHDGRMDACLIYYNHTSSTDIFKCYDSRILSIFEVEFNITDGYRSLAMGEFYDTGTNDIQEFLTPDGIYAYFSASGTFELVVNITSDVSDTTGGMIVVEADTSRVNYGVYTQSGRSVVFGFGANTTVTCGDGVCSAAETPFTCPADCLINSTADLVNPGEICTNNSQCLTNFCSLGRCDYVPEGQGCTDNNQCVSGDCSNGVCTKPSYWTLINNVKNRIYGNDENTNNMISFFLIFGTIGGVMTLGGFSLASMAISALIFYMGVIFFASVGWISGWIVLMILVLTLIVGTIAVIFRAFIGGG